MGKAVRYALLALCGAMALSVIGCLAPGDEPPVAAFTFSPQGGEAPLTVSFDASPSYDPDGRITEYRWDFGDGTLEEGIAVQHRFWEEGTYKVILTVFDDSGFSGRTATEVTVGVSWPLDVLEWGIQETAWGIEVTGRVRNIGPRPISIGRVAVRFYSATGDFIGEVSTLLYDISPGEERDFGLNSPLRPHQIDQGLTEIYTEAIHADIPRG